MIQVKVTKMNCGGCAKAVTRAIQGIDRNAAVDIDLKRGVVSISTSSEASGTGFADAIRSAGYGAEPVTRVA